MFNIGGGEFLIIFLVALVVLGPTKLPEAARQVGKVLGEFRKISSGFQRELKDALDDPVERATRDVRNDIRSVQVAKPAQGPGEDENPAAATNEPSADTVDTGDEPDDPPMHGDR